MRLFLLTFLVMSCLGQDADALRNRGDKDDRSLDCGPNEVMVGPCASRCEPTCDEPIPSLCTFDCFAGCHCRLGFLRQVDGSCVPPDECFMVDDFPIKFPKPVIPLPDH